MYWRKGCSAADLPARVYVKALVMVDAVYQRRIQLGQGQRDGADRRAGELYRKAGHERRLRWRPDRDITGRSIRDGCSASRPISKVAANADAQRYLGIGQVGALGLTASSANSVDFSWVATFRGRAGFLADPSLLLYVTGGLAVGEVKFTTQPTLTGVPVWTSRKRLVSRPNFELEPSQAARTELTTLACDALSEIARDIAGEFAVERRGRREPLAISFQRWR